MQGMIRFGVAAVSLLVSCTLIFTDSDSGLSKAITDLLNYPAPPPSIRELDESNRKIFKWFIKVRGSVDEMPEPAEDLPPLLLIGYWGNQANLIKNGARQPPSEEMQYKLLDAVMQTPDVLVRVESLLPVTPQAIERVKQYLDQTPGSGSDADRDSDSLQKPLRNWLMRHSSYFREELILKSGQMDAGPDRIRNTAEIEALARLDWPAARKIIGGYLKSSSPALITLAQALLFSHAVESGERSTAGALLPQLQRIATDANTHSDAGAYALNTLVENEWQGRDAWFISLLSNKTLTMERNQGLTIDRIASAIELNPDKLIPLVCGLVGNPDRTIHNNAAHSLAMVGLQTGNPQALKALTPWLSDPNWTSGEYAKNSRSSLVSALERTAIPEALPGLLHIVRNNTGDNEFIWKAAITALTKYRDPQAIALVRATMLKETRDEEFPEQAVRHYVAGGNLSDGEMMAVLEAAASEGKLRQHNFAGEIEVEVYGTNSIKGQIGCEVHMQKAVTENAAAGILDRIKELRRQKPQVAENLWQIAQVWDFPVIDSAIAGSIAAGSANLNTLLIALERRKSLQTNAASTLRQAIIKGGYASGVASILLQDEPGSRQILKGNDDKSRLALLACARMAREPLPIEIVGEILNHPDKQLQLGAERYLESEDSPQARSLLARFHSDKILITGARSKFDPTLKLEGHWVQWENSLSEEITKNAADEIIGIYTSNSGDAGPGSYYAVEIRIRRDNAELCRHNDSSRKECRTLADSDLQSLFSLMDEVSFSNLPPLTMPGIGFGGINYEMVRIDRKGGRRLYFTNPDSLRGLAATGTWLPYQRLIKTFKKLSEEGEYELRYPLKDKIKEMEVLSVDDKHPVLLACGEGNQIRVLIDDEENRYSKMREGNGISAEWHVFDKDRIGETSDQPPACPVLDYRNDLPDKKGFWGVSYSPYWQIRSGQGTIRSERLDEKYGLWFCSEGRAAKLIAEGIYQDYIVSADNRWVVAVKYQEKILQIVRIDLQTNREIKTGLEGGDFQFHGIPGSSKILIRYFKDQKSENLLMDPSTGKYESVKGRLEPIYQQRERPLQHVAGSREFWAAIPDPMKNMTIVGRYDANSFQFTPLMEIPEISFNSMQMWVDESAGRIYLTYNKHLLRLPLAASRN